MSAGMCVLSRVRLFATPRIVAYQAPLSMEFSRQEYWSGLPFPTPFSVSKSHLVYMLDYYLLFIKFNYILAGNPRPQASNLTPLCSNSFTQSLRIMESSTRKHCLEN